MEIDGIKVYKIIPKNVRQIIISVHGFASKKDNYFTKKMINFFVKKNIGIVSFDLPCHGDDSLNIFEIDTAIIYLEKIIKYIKTNFKNIKINLVSTSLGGYITLFYLLKNREDINKIILRYPAVDMYSSLNLINPLKNLNLNKDDLLTIKGFNGKRDITIKYSTINFFKENKVIDFISKINRNIYIIQGTIDDLVNYKEIISLNKKNKLIKYKLIKNMGHHVRVKKFTNKMLYYISNIITKN